MQATSSDASAEDKLYAYLTDGDDAELLRALYAVWRQYKAGELTTRAAYEHAYIEEWRDVLADHDRFKYYPKDTRCAALERAAAEQRSRDEVSFDD